MRRGGSVVVTGAGSTTAVGVIKGLTRQREFPIRVVACDAAPLSAGAHLAHAFHRVPAAADPGYLPAMHEICRREGARLLVPIVDAELATLARHRRLFEDDGVRVAVADEDALSVCLDKARTDRFFRSLDIPAPATWLPSQREPAASDFPVILKPRVGGRGSLNVHRADDLDAYRYHLARLPDCIVQEFVEGEEYTIDTLSDFEALPLAVVPRRRLEVRSGISYKGVIVRDETMIETARRILVALRMVGAACIQCLVRGERIVFIEVNPRFGGGTAFTIAGAGVNTPLMLARAAWGDPVAPRLGDFLEGAILLRYWDEVVVPPAAGARGRTWR